MPRARHTRRPVDAPIEVARAVAAVGALLMSCVPDLQLPLGAQVQCATTADCPADAACAVAQQRCVPRGGPCVSGAVVLPDGEPCALTGSLDAICVAGACAAPRCGDGVVSGAEACDLGAENGDAPDACRSTCEAPLCGDGIIDTDESCDGDVGQAATCDDCRPICGDGVGNCNVDGADGCECALAIADIEDVSIVRLAWLDGQAFAVRRDSETRSTLLRLDPALGVAEAVPFATPTVVGLLVVAGRPFVTADGDLFELRGDALSETRLRRDGDDAIRMLVTDGARFFARVERGVVSFYLDGRDEQTIAEVAPTFSSKQIAFVGDDVVFFDEHELLAAAKAGTDATPRVEFRVPSTQGILGHFVAELDGHPLVLSAEGELIHVMPTAPVLLARLPSGLAPSFLTDAVGLTVAAGRILFTAHSGSRSEDGLVAVPLSGGTPIPIARCGGTFAADGPRLMFLPQDEAGVAFLTLATP